MIDKPNLYIASCSFGKDSIANILLALENNEPLDRIVFSEVMFDNKRGISGEIPEHIEWVYTVAIPKLESMGVKVDIVRAKLDFVSLCRRVRKKGDRIGQMLGLQSGKFCSANSEIKVRAMRSYYTQFSKTNNIVKYIGIAIDEPKRLKRLDGVSKISLLAKYGYTEQMALNKCKEYNLLSPLYEMGHRGGCWFCFNAPLERFIHIRKNYPMLWDELNKLYYETNTKHFKYGKTLKEVERQMDMKEQQEAMKLNLFDF